ncbi:MAG: hypothetical protein QJR08_11090, partial [Bacillota bacterium]|nr:hypothetical protein [Bacillota bacterium]
MSLGLRSSLARAVYAFRSRPRLRLLGPAALWALLALAAVLLRQPSGAWRLYLFALPLVSVLILAGGLVDDP